MGMSPIRKIKHKVCGLDTSKVQDEAKCFIDIKAVCQVLYFTCSTHDHTLTVSKNLHMTAYLRLTCLKVLPIHQLLHLE